MTRSDRFERAPALYLRVHLRQRVGFFCNTEQGEQIRPNIGQPESSAVSAGLNLLAPRDGIVRAFDTEITVEQFEHRQPR